VTRILQIGLFLPFTAAGQYLISTVAGGNRLAFPAQGVTANELRLVLPVSAVSDAAGNVYISDSYYDRILRVAPGGAVTTYAGVETGFGGDGGSPTAARFNGLAGLAISPAGDLYICDLRNGRIRRIARDGQTITTVAGSGSSTHSGDGGPATAAGIGNPAGVAFDQAGNLYFSDSLNHVVRKVDSAGVITTLAGTAGRSGFGGDGGPATAALLSGPSGIALDAQGNIYIADTQNHRIRRFVAAQNRMETFAGTGTGGFTGQNAPATAAQLLLPTAVAVNRNNGDVFIADRGNGRIRRVRAGSISTVAGGGSSVAVPGPATTFDLALTVGVAIDSNEQLLVTDDGHKRIFRVQVGSNLIQAVAGVPSVQAAGDNGPATQAVLFQPSGAAIDIDGALFISDVIDNRIRRVAPNGIITTFAGTGALGSPAASGGAAIASNLGRPRGMAFDRNRNLFVASSWGGSVFRITPAGAISVFAGGATIGFSGDGGQATAARLNVPYGVAVDRNDNVYIADSGNNRVRRVDPRGVITTVAGAGQAGFSGDGGAAFAAQLNSPRAVAVDGQGNLYIADSGNHRVRRVGSDGVIRTVAGTGVAGGAGVGGPGAAAQLWSPSGLVFDSTGNLIIASSGNSVVRILTPDGTLNALAGIPGSGFAGDGGPAQEARLANPVGVAVSPDGSIFIADQNNERIRKLALIRLTAEGVLNRASRAGGAVAANEIVLIRGLNLGPPDAVTANPDPSGRYPTTLAGTQTLFDGVPAPLLSVQEKLVVAVVPAATTGSVVNLRVDYQGRPTEEVRLAVAATAPGIFVSSDEGVGPAAALNEDGTPNSEAAPAIPGSTVRFRVNGLGATDPVVADGQVVSEEMVVAPVLPVEVSIGGVAAELVSARVPVGQLAGIVEIAARVPEGVEPGPASLSVRSGETSSPGGVTLWVGPAASAAVAARSGGTAARRH